MNRNRPAHTPPRPRSNRRPARSPAGSRRAPRRSSGCACSRTSPAPISTPSRANTTPASGCMRDEPRPGDAAPASSTAGSAVNQPGSDAGAGGDRPAREGRAADAADDARSGRPARRAASAAPAPSAAPISDCAAIATASRASAQKNHSCSAIWWAASARGAEAGGHRGRGQEAGLERRAAQRAGRGRRRAAGAIAGRGGAAAPARRTAPARTARPPSGLRHDVGDRRAGQAEPDRVDEHRAEDGGEHVGAEHVVQRPAGVLHAAHPAVAGGGEQEAGRAERRRCAASRPRRRPRPGSPPASARASGPAKTCMATAMARPGGERQPGGLHALLDGGRAVAGAELPGGAAGRAVGEDGAEPGRDRHHRAADARARRAGRCRGGRRRPCRRARTAARRRARRAPAARARRSAAAWRTRLVWRSHRASWHRSGKGRKRTAVLTGPGPRHGRGPHTMTVRGPLERGLRWCYCRVSIDVCSARRACSRASSVVSGFGLRAMAVVLPGCTGARSASRRATRRLTARSGLAGRRRRGHPGSAGEVAGAAWSPGGAVGPWWRCGLNVLLNQAIVQGPLAGQPIPAIRDSEIHLTGEEVPAHPPPEARRPRSGRPATARPRSA